MLVPDLVQPLALLGAVVALTPPLGAFIARVMGERTFLHPVLGPVERLVYRGLRLLPDRSAGVGLAVAVAMIRGLTRRRAQTIGNFWVDLTRGVLYVLLPLSVLLATLLMARGVIQNFDGLRAVTGVGGAAQTLPGGPVASQEAIKELGTNGGGFYNANSAHPYENPDPLTNFLELLALLAIPFALTATYGRLVGSRRQGWALFAAMAVIWAVMVTTAIVAEQAGNPIVERAGVDQAVAAGAGAQAGGNMEGKEVRFGIGASGTWAASTTGTSTGAVNSFHDSYTAVGGLVTVSHMLLGEVSPGGVGTGLTEMLYAFASQANNNGSAFAGLTGDTAFYNLAGALAMAAGRYLPIVAVLAIAGGLATKEKVPAGPGTFPTHTPLFVGLLVGVVVIVGALTFFPVLALGPVVEQLLQGTGQLF
jgi:K+-transporting ATPase A subunit